MLAATIWSPPAVPLTATLSAAMSPVPLPGVDAKSIATCFTSVLDRSLTAMVSAPPRAGSWMFSMPLRSMVTLPTSRDSFARLPLAEMAMFSATLAPLKASVSLPAPPSTTSLPSPGSQVNRSSPLPSCATSLPRPPSMTSFPSPPISVSFPSPPVMVSFPAPPSILSWMRLARPFPAVMTSSPLLALRTRVSVVPMSRLKGAG